MGPLIFGAVQRPDPMVAQLFAPVAHSFVWDYDNVTFGTLLKRFATTRQSRFLKKASM